MTISNDFIPFCNSTGNLTALATYDSLAPAGNGPGGIAGSALVNRSLRQGTTIAALVAQYMMNITQTSVQDNYNESDVSISAILYAQYVASIANLPPVTSNILSGSGNYAPPIYFFCAAFTTPPSAGATYTNNGVTFTVLSSTTIAGVSVTLMNATSSLGAPTVSGSLIKTSGTGDATLTFYAYRSPLSLDVDEKGAGGGGAGATSSSTSDNSVGGGGGEGARCTFTIINPSLSGIAFSIGTGGVSNAGASGGNGGDTTINGITAGGGGGGITNTITLTTAQTVVSCALCGVGGVATASASVVAVGGSLGGSTSSCTTIVVSGGVGGGTGGKKGGVVNTSGTANGTAGEANSGAGGSGGAICAASSTGVTGGAGANGYGYFKANF